jgi:GT2 family glycosyltransferase
MKSSLSIVIPTYNGKRLLKKYLPSVTKYSNNAQIIIVDDASDDRTKAWLEKNYPEIKLVVFEENQGFAAAVNEGFATATTDHVLLLNNDVELKEDTIKKLSRHFKTKKKLFGVGAKELLPKGKERGRSIGAFHRGLLVHSGHVLETGNSLWVFGASGMFSKKIWDKLSGMDELYFPAYWEDIDIGYRAWKAGFTCLFDEEAALFHQAEATMNKELGWMKQVYAFKNQILFFWKNITDISLITQHVLWMPYHLVVTSLRSKGAFFLGFLFALLQLGSVFKQEKTYTDSRTDSEIIKLVN